MHTEENVVYIKDGESYKEMPRLLSEFNHPWRDLVFEDDIVAVFNDKYPVSEVHMLYVPKIDTPEAIAYAYRLAYENAQVVLNHPGPDNDFTGFNIGMNIGKSAGQTIDYPHIHLIMRADGDSENPVGGIRKVVDGNGSYSDDEPSSTIH